MSRFEAIILAAGRGKRLGELGEVIPKGLLAIAGEPMVRRSVRLLKKNGASRIILVTGHLEEKYHEQFENDSSVCLVFNERFAESGSLVSLQAGLIHADLTAPIIVLDSDIVYQETGLQRLVGEQGSSVLTSGITQSGDEVWVVSHNHQVVSISKEATFPGQEVTEFVGITRLEAPFPELILALLKSDNQSSTMEYEAALSLLCRNSRLRVCFDESLLWSEVDTPAQFKRARSLFERSQ